MCTATKCPPVKQAFELQTTRFEEAAWDEERSELERRPLHLHVHRGQPGQLRTIAVYGSAADACAESGNHVNGP